MSDPTQDLTTAFRERDAIARWTAERENAGARIALAQLHERMALILSQHEPVAMLKLDRNALRKVIDYIRAGRMPKGDE